MISELKHKTMTAALVALTLTFLVGCTALTNNREEGTDNLPVASASESADVVESVEAQTKSEEVNETHEQELSEEEKVILYLELLKDKNYTGTYGDGYTWYTAAEELGMIGKPAIPGLIQKLDTDDDYERALALYALLLASQHENVKVFTDGEYIEVNLDFDPASHPAMVEKAKAWWKKYQSNF